MHFLIKKDSGENQQTKYLSINHLQERLDSHILVRRHKKTVSQIPEKQYKRKPCTLEENYTTLTQVHFFQIPSSSGSACNSPCAPSKAKRNVSCLRLSKTGQIHADCCLKTARIRKTTKTHGGSNQVNLPTNIQKQKQTSFLFCVLELNHLRSNQNCHYQFRRETMTKDNIE